MAYARSQNCLRRGNIQATILLTKSKSLFVDAQTGSGSGGYSHLLTRKAIMLVQIVFLYLQKKKIQRFGVCEKSLQGQTASKGLLCILWVIKVGKGWRKKTNICKGKSIVNSIWWLKGRGHFIVVCSEKMQNLFCNFSFLLVHEIEAMFLFTALCSSDILATKTSRYFRFMGCSKKEETAS